MKRFSLVFGFILFVVSCSGGAPPPPNPTTNMHVFWWEGDIGGGYTLEHHWGELGSLNWNSQIEPGVNFSSATDGAQLPKMSLKKCTGASSCPSSSSMPSAHQQLSTYSIPTTNSTIPNDNNSWGDVFDFDGDRYLLYCENTDITVPQNGDVRIYRDSGAGFSHNDFMYLKHMSGPTGTYGLCGTVSGIGIHTPAGTLTNGGKFLYLFAEESSPDAALPNQNTRMHFYCLRKADWTHQGIVDTCDTTDTDGLDLIRINAGSDSHLSLDITWDHYLNKLTVTHFGIDDTDPCSFSMLNTGTFDPATYTDANWNTFNFDPTLGEGCWDKKIEYVSKHSGVDGYYVISSLHGPDESLWLYGCDTFPLGVSDCFDSANWFQIQAVKPYGNHGGTNTDQPCGTDDSIGDIPYDMTTTSNGEIILVWRVPEHSWFTTPPNPETIKYASFTLSGNSFVPGPEGIVAQTPTIAGGTDCNDLSIGVLADYSTTWGGYDIIWGDLDSIHHHQGSP